MLSHSSFIFCSAFSSECSFDAAAEICSNSSMNLASCMFSTLKSVVPESGVRSKPAIADIFAQCRCRMPGLHSTEMYGRYSFERPTWSIIFVHTSTAAGTWTDACASSFGVSGGGGGASTPAPPSAPAAPAPPSAPSAGCAPASPLARRSLEPRRRRLRSRSFSSISMSSFLTARVSVHTSTCTKLETGARVTVA